MFMQALDQCMRYIADIGSGTKTLLFHGNIKLKWKQSYDLSAWWKMLALSGIMGEGDYCPFCTCNRTMTLTLRPGKRLR